MKENEAFNASCPNAKLFMKESSSFNLITNKPNRKPFLLKKNRKMEKCLSSQAFFDTYSVQNVDPIDLENLNENIIKAKHQFLKKNKELLDLKISYQQLKNQSNSHIRVMEAILNKSRKTSNSLSISPKPLLLLENTDLNESKEATLVQPEDSKLVSSLKNHLVEAKTELSEWVKEYELVNQREKVIQMRESEMKLAKSEEKIKALESNNKQLQNIICEVNRKLNDCISTEVNYRNDSNQMQFSIRDLNNQLEILKKAQTSFEISISQHEHTMERNKIEIIQLIEQIKQREDLIDKSNEQKGRIEGMRTEKANYEQRMNDNKKKLRMAAVDLEKAQKKNRDFELNKEHLAQKVNAYEKERPKLSSYSKESVLSFRDKDKKIKELKKEIVIVEKNKEYNNKKYQERINEMTQQNIDSNDQIENIQKEIEELNDTTRKLETRLSEKKGKQLDSLENEDGKNMRLISELNEEINKAKDKKEVKAKKEFTNLITEKKERLRRIEEEIKLKKNNENKYVKEKTVLTAQLNEKNKKIKSLREKISKLEKQKGKSLLPSTLNDEDFKAFLNADKVKD